MWILITLVAIESSYFSVCQHVRVQISNSSASVFALTAFVRHLPHVRPHLYLKTWCVYAREALVTFVCLLTSRVAGLGRLSAGAKMAMKPFVKRVFTFFATNSKSDLEAKLLTPGQLLGYPRKVWGITVQTSYWEGRWHQNWVSSRPTNLFTKLKQNFVKNGKFLLFGLQLENEERYWDGSNRGNDCYV